MAACSTACSTRSSCGASRPRPPTRLAARGVRARAPARAAAAARPPGPGARRRRARPALREPARRRGRRRQGRELVRGPRRARLRLRRGRHGHAAGAGGQPAPARAAADRRPRAAEQHGLPEPRRGRGRRAPRAPPRADGASASTSGASKGATAEQAAGDYRATVLPARPAGRLPRRSTSPRPTRPACATCRPSSRCAGSSPPCARRSPSSASSGPCSSRSPPTSPTRTSTRSPTWRSSSALDGIVATNTTVGRTGLRSAGVPAAGGVSGAPLKARSLAVLRAAARPRPATASCSSRSGGIETADDVWERLQAGATLVQAYTGFVYGGPGWPRRVNRELAAAPARRRRPRQESNLHPALRRRVLYPLSYEGLRARSVAQRGSREHPCDLHTLG